MSRAPARLALALLAAFLVLAGSPGRSAQPAAAPVAPEFPYVNTLRTTGAEFSMPSGLAYDRAGTLYVADAALHAIFSVDRAGRAQLFAGPASRRTSLAAGAYADGPARTARFDEPMGLAIAADGDVLVADANNHCLRRIHAGVVSTLAGHCTFQDSRDGPAAAAYFRRPLALALDPSNGDLYIADFDAGLRKLDAAGMVTTPFPDLPNKRITGVALAGDTLLVVDTEGCTVLHPHGGGSTRYLSGSGGNALDGSSPEGHEFAGFPYGGVALSPRDFVLGDVGMHDVRYLHRGYSRVIAGEHDVDALISGGGFADGRGDVARFNVPLAIAAAGDGTLVVADAGNHALRVLGPFDRGLGDAASADSRVRPGDYRVALVGGSGMWWMSDAAGSLANAIQNRLGAEQAIAGAGLRPWVASIPARDNTPDGILAAVEALGERDGISAREHFDTIVVAFDASQLAEGDADAALIARLTALRTTLGARNTNLLAVIDPRPPDVAAWESYAYSVTLEANGAAAADAGRARGAFARALGASGVRTLDLTQPMAADEFAPHHRPLFMSADPHFSVYGREFAGALLATELLRNGAWKAALAYRAPGSRVLAHAPLEMIAGAKRTPGPYDAREPHAASIVPSDDPPADPRVETIRLAGARFAMPSGLVYDRAGTLYVADAALQTIFSVDAAGRARPFAGLAGPGTRPVDGAYADGPASSARFDAPMGLAVNAVGDLLVADANNHCLRLIHAGEVSTLAGRCTVAGNRDGPAASALFERPLALAVDGANGDVYIADDGGGLRKLSAAGVVTTPFADQTDKRVTGVALADYNLLVVDAGGLTLRDLPSGKPIRYVAGSAPNVFADGAFMSHEFGGFPYAAAPLSPRQFVLTDARMHGVRFLNWLRSRVIAGSRDVDADLVGGGYVDGTGENARFNVPLAVALAPNGSLVVADAGNHVLRRLGRFDRSWNEHSSPVPEEYHFRPDEYRVALVGNSAVWWSSDRPSSTQAAIERRLATDPAFAAAGVHPRVVTFGLGSPKLDATVSAITEVIALEHFDTVVLELNTVQLPGNQLGLAQRDPASWKPELMVDLAKLRTELAADGVTLLVAVAPIFGELVPWESYAGYVDWGTGNAVTNDWTQAPAALANAVAASGVPALDLTAPMLADEFAPQHRPLFMALDGHYSAYGRVFVGTAIGAELARRRSWLAMAGRVRRGRDPTR